MIMVGVYLTQTINGGQNCSISHRSGAIWTFSLDNKIFGMILKNAEKRFPFREVRPNFGIKSIGSRKKKFFQSSRYQISTPFTF